jgi:hypothetical protein
VRNRKQFISPQQNKYDQLFDEPIKRLRAKEHIESGGVEADLK